MSKTLEVKLSTGAVLPYRPATAKSGNVYHTILNPATGKAPGKFGVNVSAPVVGGKLPTHATILGVKVPLASGVVEQSGNAKVSATNVPVVLDGEPRSFSLSISQTPRGFNVRGSLNRPGGGGSALADAL